MYNEETWERCIRASHRISRFWSCITKEIGTTLKCKICKDLGLSVGDVIQRGRGTLD